MIRFQEDEKSDPMQSSATQPRYYRYVGDYEFTIAANIDDFEYALNLDMPSKQVEAQQNSTSLSHFGANSLAIPVCLLGTARAY